MNPSPLLLFYLPTCLKMDIISGFRELEVNASISVGKKILKMDLTFFLSPSPRIWVLGHNSALSGTQALGQAILMMRMYEGPSTETWIWVRFGILFYGVYVCIASR